VPSEKGFLNCQFCIKLADMMSLKLVILNEVKESGAISGFPSKSFFAKKDFPSNPG
jgi:hypothetical protein